MWKLLAPCIVGLKCCQNTPVNNNIQSHGQEKSYGDTSNSMGLRGEVLCHKITFRNGDKEQNLILA